MPSSRPPYERLLWLDREIRAGRYPSVESLAEEFEVTERTAFRDVAFLRYNLGAPLEFDRARNGYAYTSATYSLPWVNLTQGELVALFVAEKVLAQYASTPYEVDLRSAFEKLAEALPDEVSVDLAALQDTVSFDPGPTRPIEMAMYRAALEAITGRQRLQVRYYTAGRAEVTDRVLDPLHLHNMAGDWYLIAYDHLRREVRDFALSRFRSMRLEGTQFETHNEFDLAAHLGSQFGGFRGTEQTDIEIRFDPYQSRWIREKQWPGEVGREESEDGRLTLTLRVANLDAATRWVAQYGPHAEALVPKQWREAVRDYIKGGAGVYGGGRSLQSDDPIGGA